MVLSPMYIYENPSLSFPFTKRVDECNSFSSHVVGANAIDTFKERLDKVIGGEERWD